MPEERTRQLCWGCLLLAVALLAQLFVQVLRGPLQQMHCDATERALQRCQSTVAEHAEWLGVLPPTDGGSYRRR